MSLTDEAFVDEDLHPIDVVEALARANDWDFDRVGDDEIAMAVAGQWKTYAVTLASTGSEELLRLVATFEMVPPADKLPALYAALNRINDLCRTGAFAYWPEEQVMTWRYGLVLAGGEIASPEQIDRMIANAVAAAERFYPALQLVAWGDASPEAALQVAIAETYGRA